MIATKTVSGDVLLFDYSKHPTRPNIEGVVNAQATLKGHSAEGYALDWSTVNDHFVASGADDNLVCVWDTKSGSCDSALVTLAGHSRAVEAVAWNYFNPSSVVSVGDDRRILLWDIREPGNPVSKKSNAHNGDINAVSWSPHTEFLFATSGSDTVVNLWDARKMDTAIYSLDGAHTGEVTNVNWSPFHEHVLASSGVDRRVVVWDLSRIGDDLTSEEAADGPPELLFIHSGHTGRVNDFAWNGNEEWMIASTADDNILQVWKMGENVWCTDSDDEE
jgi:WD40 repeat protein